jgi:transcriptional regulator with XRE-family HTH domain
MTMPIEKETLGAAIKNVRLARGLTQQQLAERAGMSPSGKSIALIEQGRRSVSMEALNQIGTALEIPAACLAILGSSGIAGNKAATEFQQSLQKLISAVVVAQTQASQEEAGQQQLREIASKFKSLGSRPAGQKPGVRSVPATR